MSEEGGTKLRNRNVPQQMGGGMGQMGGGMPPQMAQQMGQMPPQMAQQMGQMPPQMRATPQQAPPQQMYQQQVQEEAPQLPKSVLKKTKYGPFSINNKNIRNGVIVVVIFILLNSKFIWKALGRLPMMGTFEPSILALVVNSIIAGIVFYVISTKVNETI
jgi:hypothetical protein